MDSENTLMRIRKSDYVRDYLKVSSISLSLIRSFELDILSRRTFEKPVLDIGCGDGLFAGMLFDEKIANGIDISPHEIEMARVSGRYIEATVAHADKMPFPDNHFGSAFSNCVIEHVENLPGTFKEIYRVLRPGGKMYITTHSDKYEQYFLYTELLKKIRLEKLGKRYSRLWRKLWHHNNCLPEAEWTAVVRDAGFPKIKIIPYVGPGAVHIFDLFLPLAIPSYIVRKLTGKWKLFPRIVSMSLAEMIVRYAMRKHGTGDWCYLIEAEK